MAKLPTFNGADFVWNKGNGCADFNDLYISSFPSAGFYIRSHKTGDVKLFLPDADTMEANEFFDGEGAAYFVPGGEVRVQIWVGNECPRPYLG